MWAQVINAVLGIWLMVAPSVLAYGSPAQDVDHIFGPIATTFAVVAFWEATRPARWANLPIGFWLVLSPWVLGYSSAVVTANSMVVGVLLMAFSLVQGQIAGRYGGGWSSLWKSNTLHEQEAGKRGSI